MAFTLSSSAFAPQGAIPRAYTCDGKDASPPLAWSDPPSAVKAFALVCEDPDAPAGTWIHWVIYDIPAGARGLEEGLKATPRFENGSSQGRNDFGRTGYGGPCPPQGKPHRYIFTLYALDRPLGLKAGSTNAELQKAMAGRVLAKTSMFGTYHR